MLSRKSNCSSSTLWFVSVRQFVFVRPCSAYSALATPSITFCSVVCGAVHQSLIFYLQKFTYTDYRLCIYYTKKQKKGSEIKGGRGQHRHLFHSQRKHTTREHSKSTEPPPRLASTVEISYSDFPHCNSRIAVNCTCLSIHAGHLRSVRE